MTLATLYGPPCCPLGPRCTVAAMDYTSETHAQVRYSDFDSMGVMHHAAALALIDVDRLITATALGLPPLPVHRLTATFHAPIRLADCDIDEEDVISWGVDIVGTYSLEFGLLRSDHLITTPRGSGRVSLSTGYGADDRIRDLFSRAVEAVQK